MTYLKPTAAVRRYARPRRRGLSGFFDTVTGDLTSILGQPSPESQCLTQANAASAPFDAKIDDLAKNWNPTGFYSTADLRSIVSSAMSTVQQGQALLNQAAAEPNASQDSVMRATDDLGRAGSRSLDYLQAATQADQQGIALVNAPGLKRWVTDTMAAASSAMVTAATIGCITPWWVNALATFQSAFDTAWSVVKQVVGAVLAIGETALKVADDLPQLTDLLELGLVVMAGYWVWNEFFVHGGRR